MLKFNSYDDLINFAKSQTRTKGSYVYYELHHIVPKHDGGTNDKDNLVLLTLYEHLLAHYLLAVKYENIDRRKYFTNLSACGYIMSATDKHFQTLEAKEYLRSILENPDSVELLNLIKIKNQKREPPIKGRCFVMKDGVRKCINQNLLKEYESLGWEKQTIEFKWVQLNNRRPERFSVRKTDKKIEEGYIIIDECPICHKPNSRDDWCCCAEHHEQFEKERKELQSKANSEKAKNTWKGDNTERLRKIGEANKIALKGKHWMNKDGVSKQFAPEDIEKAILEGWKRGRIMPNNPVLSRWQRS